MKKLSDREVDVTAEWKNGMGLSAGLLWHYLGKHGRVSIKQLKADADKIVAYALKPFLSPPWPWKKEDGVYMALTWLGYEGKIMGFGHIATGDESFCLNQTEQEIYWQMCGNRDS